MTISTLNSHLLLFTEGALGSLVKRNHHSHHHSNHHHNNHCRCDDDEEYEDDDDECECFGFQGEKKIIRLIDCD